LIGIGSFLLFVAEKRLTTEQEEDEEKEYYQGGGGVFSCVDAACGAFWRNLP
jgi:hypothetical protein